ncbi:uncharacterized protein AMSG_03188 [Thecamonas trahens ATCC 50062]|uniref:PSI domain-containing protein n=1 Tax=Thecamonas trahens ATCC 50062 TaxID=461836 RepID=A0A0L0D371_THETB|nr:hypothetical protein AMSG_03188 [Thecamonas trahens ATCC 50062]KNC46759.1 hypothetical protein AMSG_03188 [Thecamonas trahens ATCC 50062]|eukprot:XP_013760039.1 hypothetical protein AMSG_03188 [Thecamonas trahens ATCC 50062]
MLLTAVMAVAVAGEDGGQRGRDLGEVGPELWADKVQVKPVVFGAGAAEVRATEDDDGKNGNVVAEVMLASESGRLGSQAFNCSERTSCTACKAHSSCGWCQSTKSCSKGSFLGPDHGTCDDWRKSFCFVADKWLLVGGAGLLFLILSALCCCVYCKCRARSKRKTQSLLDDYERWVDDMEKSTSATPRTNARREQMNAKYGHLMPKSPSTNGSYGAI